MNYDHLSEEEQQDLIKLNPYDIKYISNPSEELQKFAVTKTGYALVYIKNPSKELKKLAVIQNGYVIKYVKNPSLSFIKSILDEMNPKIHGYDHLKEIYTKRYLSENNISIYE